MSTSLTNKVSPEKHHLKWTSAIDLQLVNMCWRDVRCD